MLDLWGKEALHSRLEGSTKRFLRQSFGDSSEFCIRTPPNWKGNQTFLWFLRTWALSSLYVVSSFSASTPQLNENLIRTVSWLWGLMLVVMVLKSEEGRLFKGWGQPWLLSDFLDGLGYTVRSISKNKTKQNNEQIKHISEGLLKPFQKSASTRQIDLPLPTDVFMGECHLGEQRCVIYRLPQRAGLIALV